MLASRCFSKGIGCIKASPATRAANSECRAISQAGASSINPSLASYLLFVTRITNLLAFAGVLDNLSKSRNECHERDSDLQ
jgi:hypothetical protein